MALSVRRHVRFASWNWWFRCLSPLALCALSPGCANTQRTLYAAHLRIPLGQPLSDHMGLPDDTQLEHKGEVWVAERKEEWKFGRFIEQTVYLTDANGLLAGKRYLLIHEEVALLFQWQFGRFLLEWEFAHEPDQPGDSLRPVCETLGKERPPRMIPPGLLRPCEFLDTITGDSRFGDRDFDRRRVEAMEFFPIDGRIAWRAHRTGDRAIRLSAQCRMDFIMPIHVPLAWIMLPFQKF